MSYVHQQWLSCVGRSTFCFLSPSTSMFPTHCPSHLLICFMILLLLFSSPSEFPSFLSSPATCSLFPSTYCQTFCPWIPSLSLHNSLMVYSFVSYCLFSLSPLLLFFFFHLPPVFPSFLPSSLTNTSSSVFLALHLHLSSMTVCAPFIIHWVSCRLAFISYSSCSIKPVLYFFLTLIFTTFIYIRVFFLSFIPSAFPFYISQICPFLQLCLFLLPIWLHLFFMYYVALGIEVIFCTYLIMTMLPYVYRAFCYVTTFWYSFLSFNCNISRTEERYLVLPLFLPPLIKANISIRKVISQGKVFHTFAKHVETRCSSSNLSPSPLQSFFFFLLAFFPLFSYHLLSSPHNLQRSSFSPVNPLSIFTLLILHPTSYLVFLSQSTSMKVFHNIMLVCNWYRGRG